MLKVESLEQVKIKFLSSDEIKISGTVDLVEEYKCEKYNKNLEFYCVSKKRNKFKTSLDIEYKLGIEPIILHSIKLEEIKQLILSSLSIKSISYTVSDTTFKETFSKKEVNVIRKTEKESYYSSNTGEHLHKIEEECFYFDRYYFAKKILEKFKELLREKLGDFVDLLDIYDDCIFLDLEKVLKKEKTETFQIPYLIGGWGSVNLRDLKNSTVYKYLLESPKIVVDETFPKIKFQKYFLSKNFNLLGITFSDKNLCDLRKKDFIEFKEKTNKEIQMELLLKLYEESEKKLEEMFSDELKILFDLIKNSKKNN